MDEMKGKLQGYVRLCSVECTLRVLYNHVHNTCGSSRFYYLSRGVPSGCAFYREP